MPKQGKITRHFFDKKSGLKNQRIVFFWKFSAPISVVVFCELLDYGFGNKKFETNKRPYIEKIEEHQKMSQ